MRASAEELIRQRHRNISRRADLEKDIVTYIAAEIVRDFDALSTALGTRKIEEMYSRMEEIFRTFDFLNANYQTGDKISTTRGGIEGDIGIMAGWFESGTFEMHGERWKRTPTEKGKRVIEGYIALKRMLDETKTY